MATRSNKQGLASDVSSTGRGGFSAGRDQAELLGSITQANGAKDKERTNIFREIRAGQSDRVFESVTFPQAVTKLLGDNLAFEDYGYILQSLNSSERMGSGTGYQDNALNSDDFEVILKQRDKSLGLVENLLDYNNGNIGYSVITDAGAFPKGGNPNNEASAKVRNALFDMYEAGQKMEKAIKTYEEVRDMSESQKLRRADGTALWGRARKDLANALIDFREARNSVKEQA